MIPRTVEPASSEEVYSYLHSLDPFIPIVSVRSYPSYFEAVV
jgi:hypothetical protein